MSVPANIAEGYGRNGRAEHVHHVGIARGSLYELETLIEIARLRGYLSEVAVLPLTSRTRELAATLTRLRLRLAKPG